jgi:hypothetical protein
VKWNGMMSGGQTKGFRMWHHARYLTVSTFVNAEHNFSLASVCATVVVRISTLWDHTEKPMSHDDLQGTPVKAVNIYREVLLYTNIRFENTAATNRNKYTPILSHIVCDLPVYES